MLWYKGWLETRVRVAFVVATMVLFPSAFAWTGLTPPNKMWVLNAAATPMLICFAAIFLAGSGVNTQSTYGMGSGFHGSMIFTLSLPVSRVRLLFVRTLVGLAETYAAVVVAGGLAFLWQPAGRGVGALLQIKHIGVALVCATAVYMLSLLLACIFDETWQFQGTFLLVAAMFAVQLRFASVARMSPLRGLGVLSNPTAVRITWEPLATAVVVSSLLFCAAMRIAQQKEY